MILLPRSQLQSDCEVGLSFHVCLGGLCLFSLKWRKINVTLKKKIKIVGCIPLALTNHTLAVGEQVLYLSSSLKCRWHWPPRDCLRIRWCVLLNLLRSRHQDETKHAKMFLEEMPVRDSGVEAWENQEGRDCEEARLILREGRGRKVVRHPCRLRKAPHGAGAPAQQLSLLSAVCKVACGSQTGWKRLACNRYAAPVCIAFCTFGVKSHFSMASVSQFS